MHICVLDPIFWPDDLQKLIQSFIYLQINLSGLVFCKYFCKNSGIAKIYSQNIDPVSVFLTKKKLGRQTINQKT